MVYNLAIQTQVATHAIGSHAGMYRQDPQQIAYFNGCQQFIRSLNDSMFLGNAFHKGTVAWNTPAILVQQDNLSEIFASISVYQDVFCQMNASSMNEDFLSIFSDIYYWYRQANGNILFGAAA
jgi:hypothetical protein